MKDFISLNLLPNKYHYILIEASKTLGLNYDYLFTTLLTSVAGLVGNRAKIELKKGWSEPCIMWSIIIGNPSAKKTPAMNFIINPILDLDFNQFKKLNEEIEEVKNNRQQFVLKDSTVEAVYQVLKHNPYGVMFYCDEMMTFVNNLSRYKNNSDKSHFLSIYNNEHVVINRKKEGESFMISNAAVSIIGSIQPDVLPFFFDCFGTNDGGAQRFLYCYPSIKTKTCWIEEELNISEYNEFKSLLLRIPSYLEEFCINESLTYALSDEAKLIFEEFYNNTHANAIKEETLEQTFMIKGVAQVARLSLVFQIIEDSLSIRPSKKISFESMEKAIAAYEIFNLYRQKALLNNIKSELTELDQIAVELLPEKFTNNDAKVILADFAIEGTIDQRLLPRLKKQKIIINNGKRGDYVFTNLGRSLKDIL